MDSVNVTAKFEVRNFTQSWDDSGYLKTLGSPWIRRSRSSKVSDFGSNWKRVCDRLPLSPWPYLAPFRRYCRFLCSWVTPPLFHPNFRGVPVAPARHVGVSPRIGLKLFGREIIFEEFQPMWSRYLNVTDRRTDRQTDYILWHNRALERSIAR